jgi:hypothetical protein
MLRCQRFNSFATSNRVYLEGGERYTDAKSGVDTKHATEVAKSYSERTELQEIVSQNNFPAKNTLNWLTHDTAYTVKSTDTKGAYDVLKREGGDFFTKSKLVDLNYLRVSFASMMDTANSYNKNPNVDHTKTYSVNFIEPGDKLFVKDGLLFFLRKAGSKFASFGVPLYPWKKDAANPAAAPTPSMQVAPTTPTTQSNTPGLPTARDAHPANPATSAPPSNNPPLPTPRDAR